MPELTGRRAALHLRGAHCSSFAVKAPEGLKEITLLLLVLQAKFKAMQVVKLLASSLTECHCRVLTVTHRNHILISRIAGAMSI